MSNIFPANNALPLDSRAFAIRKTTVTFASLFKDIPLIKYDQYGKETERVKIPIVYSNKEKYVKRLEGDPGEIDKKVQITLPRIEYGLLGIQYDLSRKTNQANKIVGCGSNATVYVNSPAPYNFQFELTLYTRNIEETNQIMEYILPYFTPDYNVKINMVPQAGISKNVPITLNGIIDEQDSTGMFDSAVRSIFRTLSFTARSFIFGAPNYYKPILEATTNIYSMNPKHNFYLSSANTGKFAIGESVYQGVVYDRATAIGSVDSWDYQTKILSVTVLKGAFVANTNIQNISKTAIYNLVSMDSDNLLVKTVITPTPNTYPVIGTYDYNIITTRY
jgi:hypothetical protein